MSETIFEVQPKTQQGFKKESSTPTFAALEIAVMYVWNFCRIWRGAAFLSSPCWWIGQWTVIQWFFPAWDLHYIASPVWFGDRTSFSWCFCTPIYPYAASIWWSFHGIWLWQISRWWYHRWLLFAAAVIHWRNLRLWHNKNWKTFAECLWSEKPHPDAPTFGEAKTAKFGFHPMICRIYPWPYWPPHATPQNSICCLLFFFWGCNHTWS